MKINIALAGGPCTGKSTLAAMLFSELKIQGFDYDLIGEEKRKLKKEFGDFRNPFERFYMWRQQEREELRSTAANGFITDMPLFQFYIQVRKYACSKRDNLAVRELFRMCLEIESRYRIIAIAKNPNEIPYKKDNGRSGTRKESRQGHALTKSFIEHEWPDKLLLIHGDAKQRMQQVLRKLKEISKTKPRR